LYSYRGRVTFRISNNNPTTAGSPNASLSAVFWGGTGVPSGDSTPPSVSITSPGSGSIVSGPITVTATATDNTAVAAVQFRLDGVNLGGEITVAPYSRGWDTTGASNGAHVLTAVARDGAGNTSTSASVTVTVSNTFVDTAPPSLSITSPTGGTTVSGSVSITATATDNVGVVGLQYKLDGVNLGPERASTPYLFTWDTTGIPNGTHTLGAVARDSAGNVGTATDLAVAVLNGTAPNPNVAVFVGVDTTTKGNWKGVYGQDGNYIVQNSTYLPGYSTFAASNANSYVRNAFSDDPRALQKFTIMFRATERIESHFHAVQYMDFDVSASDAQSHRIALYFCDWDNAGRSITVEARDAITGTVLDSRPLNSYGGGVYLIYNYRGKVVFRVKNNNPVATAPTASISAFFWGG
jgi:hypothetical protein